MPVRRDRKKRLISALILAIFALSVVAYVAITLKP